MDGNAIIYCEGAFRSPNGKTAHGLVRRTSRYQVLSVIDATCEGKDAGELLDGKACGIPIFADLEDAVTVATAAGTPATHLVVGLAPDGGRLPEAARQDIVLALSFGLHVDCGLHDFLSEDPELAGLAERAGVTIRDVRRPPDRKDLHGFTGRIKEVKALRVAVLGTDSAVGKRTTAWLLTDALREAGITAELVGTGQTAWLQGARFGIILDSLVNDFVAGEIEHAICTAWEVEKPRAMVLEGQGSLLNPAYPGGFEILAAGRPHGVILQHAPARKDYDGFPGYPIQPLDIQIAAIELVSRRPVLAIAINPEDLDPADVQWACEEIERKTGLPTVDVLTSGAGRLVEALKPFLEARLTSPEEPALPDDTPPPKAVAPVT